MPELPEVETVRRGLALVLTGQQVTQVDAQGVAKLRRPQAPQALTERLLGGVMGEVRRRGKYLLLEVKGRGALMVHLGMTGRLEWVDGRAPAEKHTHLRLGFAGRGEALRFVDPRRFGMVVWIEEGAEATDPSLSQLGAEPLEGTLEALIETLGGGLKAERRAMKLALMDQSLLAGLGNIYVCEALWRAGISPRRAGQEVTPAEVARLGGEVRAVLEEALASKGTTLRDYRGVDGSAGGFGERLAVYGREAEGCARCAGVIVKETQGGRSTFWCPGCQR
jgi:formamidopyrimidine-DNA glycosylase